MLIEYRNFSRVLNNMLIEYQKHSNREKPLSIDGSSFLAAGKMKDWSKRHNWAPRTDNLATYGNQKTLWGNWSFLFWWENCKWVIVSGQAYSFTEIPNENPLPVTKKLKPGHKVTNWSNSNIIWPCATIEVLWLILQKELVKTTSSIWKRIEFTGSAN